MSQAVSKSQFKPHALEHFRKIEQTGEELIITDHGRPVLRVVPYVADPEECLRGLRNTVLRYDAPLDPVGSEEWERAIRNRFSGQHVMDGKGGWASNVSAQFCS